MSISINKRIEDAEKRLQELKRTQSFEGYVAITKQNVVLPDAVREDVGKQSRVLKIKIVSLGYQDDDLMLSIGGVKIFNTRLSANMYYGEQELFGYVNRNKKWRTEGFRIATVTRASAIEKGAEWLVGSIVSVNTANVVPKGWATHPWLAYLYLDSGVTVTIQGGSYAEGEEENATNHPNGNFKLI
jgi:hypothetical protein